MSKKVKLLKKILKYLKKNAEGVNVDVHFKQPNCEEKKSEPENKAIIPPYKEDVNLGINKL